MSGCKRSFDLLFRRVEPAATPEIVGVGTKHRLRPTPQYVPGPGSLIRTSSNVQECMFESCLGCILDCDRDTIQNFSPILRTVYFARRRPDLLRTTLFLFRQISCTLVQVKPNITVSHAPHRYTCEVVKLLTWCCGKMSVSAMTTFSLRVAANTTTSAMSSGVNGSMPLNEPSACDSFLPGFARSISTHILTRIPCPPSTCRHRTEQ